MRKLSKKQKIAAAGTAAVVAVAGGGIAYAYWSTSGSGTGSAATSAGASNLAIAQTSTLSSMYPGDTPQTISGTVTNNASQSAYVAQVVVSIASVTKGGSPVVGCDATDYALTNPTMNVAKDIAGGSSTTFSGATIQFNDKTSNQDACKGATVNLAYAAS